MLSRSLLLRSAIFVFVTSTLILWHHQYNEREENHIITITPTTATTITSKNIKTGNDIVVVRQPTPTSTPTAAIPAVPSKRLQQQQDTRNRPAWHKVLYTPTYVTRIDGTWFIVDCWHHRVLYSDDLDAPILQWRALDRPEEGFWPDAERGNGNGDGNGGLVHNHMSIPHSIAHDGERIVVENSNAGSDGPNHSLLVYAKEVSGYKCVQEINVCDNNRARRPHRVVYDHAFTKSFFVYLTKPAHLSRFSVEGSGSDEKKKQKVLKRDYCVSLPFMKGAYARSIYIHTDGMMYITSGPKGIWAVDHQSSRDGVRPVKFYSVAPLRMKTMNDLIFVNGWWYATSTVPCGFRRFRSLENMRDNEDLAARLGLCQSVRGLSTGTPYFLTYHSGRLFVPFIFSHSGVISFALDHNSKNTTTTTSSAVIGDVRRHWEGAWRETDADVAVRNGDGKTFGW
eukprot:PhM_4_TR17713/c0_g1_i1/m.59550